MISHDHIGMQVKSFSFLAVLKRFDNNITIALPGKYVYPANYCKSHVINALLIVYDIASARHALNIALFPVVANYRHSGSKSETSNSATFYFCCDGTLSEVSDFRRLCP